MKFIIELSLLGCPGRCFEGLDRSRSAPDIVGALAKSNFTIALREFLISGVASLSSRGSGDRGVSPADESSKSLLSFRGVLYRALYAGIEGKGLEGENCPGVLDFEGESEVSIAYMVSPPSQKLRYSCTHSSVVSYSRHYSGIAANCR